MAECLSSNVPRLLTVNEQHPLNVCVYSTDAPEQSARVIVTLKNPSQREHFDLVLFTDGQFIPVTFNAYGVFVFEEPMLNNCALLFITFTKPGDYAFELDLVSDEGNIHLAKLFLEVEVV
ncbi:hypothetical protein [Thalassobacillus sp. CUG 92003]|uniref:hypothetical protein n=1 Tax=Thalassobacillus sp. CUG 92003 TaxID=2736641 RepID=UPI0015E6DAC2|nr:hypothetical protein [Thalassobacillus sp. CUG 92003]